jgi:hypothetical protein
VLSSISTLTSTQLPQVHIFSVSACHFSITELVSLSKQDKFWGSSEKKQSMASTNCICICLILAMFLFLSNTECEAHLSSAFYDNTCPKALSTIRTAIRTAVSRERRMAASLIRLHFHDCFVQVINLN